MKRYLPLLITLLISSSYADDKKYIVPTEDICTSNHGVMQDGMCVATNISAHKICEQMGLNLPSIDTLRSDMTSCGGTEINYATPNKREKRIAYRDNAAYQTCLSNAGFVKPSLVWSSTKDPGANPYPDHYYMIPHEAYVTSQDQNYKASVYCIK